MSSGVETLNPGELRRYVTFQAFSREQDETGGMVEVWTDVLKAWAKIDPKLGAERFDAAQDYPTVLTEITIRWRPGLDPSMRIIDEYNDQYDIKYISDIELRHHLLVIGTVKVIAGRHP